MNLYISRKMALSGNLIKRKERIKTTLLRVFENLSAKIEKIFKGTKG